MKIKLGNYIVHSALLALLLVIVIYGLIADSEKVAFFIIGIYVNLLDPIVWLVTLPFSVYLRRQRILLPALFILGVISVVVKIRYLSLSGSIAGEVYGVVTVGYIINAIILVRQGWRGKNTGSCA